MILADKELEPIKKELEKQMDEVKKLAGKTN